MEKTGNPLLLKYGRIYDWQIIVRDKHGAEAISPIWSFTTPPNNPTSFLEIANSVMWFDDDNISHEVIISNIGTGEFDWEIQKTDEQAQYLNLNPKKGICEAAIDAGQTIELTPTWTNAIFEQNYEFFSSLTNATLRCTGFSDSALGNNWELFPTNGAMGVSVETSLSWKNPKLPDVLLSNSNSWDLYFGTNDPSLFPETVKGTRFKDSTNLLHTTKYYWYVSKTIKLLEGTSEEHEITLSSPTYNFTTYGDSFVCPKTGDDNKNGSERFPFKTITKALSHAQDDINTIFLFGGKYKESVNVNRSVKISSKERYGKKENRNDGKHTGFLTVKKTIIDPPKNLRAFNITTSGVTIEGPTFKGGGKVNNGGVNPLIQKSLTIGI